MSKESMKLALEALSQVAPLNSIEAIEFDNKRNKAITALREALAEQPAQQHPKAKQIAECLTVLRPLVKGKFPQEQALEELAAYTFPQPAQQQEPVAGDVKDQALTALNRMQSLFMMDDGRHPRDVLRAYIQLTAAPPASKPWVGLTDGERLDAERLADQQYVETRGQELRPSWASLFCRDIEAKLREKNNG